ncbi:hypothetical protein B8V81_4335 [Paenibacillus pasadenensis]|uniref:Uncharacterized protein n=1 Tax=Paenibacillus pasadenensis TaxID=217090 RepID=A0A2N5N6C1_9BACL|nr:hypothetical protein B8V81_4335 [Paenibacillus pasadenensis]
MPAPAVLAIVPSPDFGGNRRLSLWRRGDFMYNGFTNTVMWLIEGDLECSGDL